MKCPLCETEMVPGKKLVVRTSFEAQICRGCNTAWLPFSPDPVDDSVQPADDAAQAEVFPKGTEMEGGFDA